MIKYVYMNQKLFGNFLDINEVINRIINNLNHNDIVYARLTDGSTATPEQTKQIKDEKEPEITLNIVIITGFKVSVCIFHRSCA